MIFLKIQVKEYLLIMSNLLLKSSFNYECRTNTRLSLCLENQEKNCLLKFRLKWKTKQFIFILTLSNIAYCNSDLQ